ncbi:MAG: GNAT family N-acetyltransferase [Bacteriovorax sp.]|jgi:ribosomal protein S18 acetylase RimI-like enzyme
MKIKSRGFRTDLFFHHFTGVVLEYEDFLVVKTPTNPTFFWGNLIYFSAPPAEGSLEKWKILFREHFHSMNVEHMTFAWDSPEGTEGLVAPFINDGFDLEKSVVMSARNIVLPIKYNRDIVVRPIETEDEWLLIVENHVLARGDNFQEVPFRKFASRQISNYRLMVNNKLGYWLGAFLGEQLVGDLGIFSEHGLARFQTVVTRPDFRRRGVCSTLVYETCKFAMDKMNAEELIMVADPEYHAAKIYESVGFTPCELQIGVCKFNKDVWAT